MHTPRGQPASVPLARIPQPPRNRPENRFASVVKEHRLPAGAETRDPPVGAWSCKLFLRATPLQRLGNLAGGPPVGAGELAAGRSVALAGIGGESAESGQPSIGSGERFASPGEALPDVGKTATGTGESSADAGEPLAETGEAFSGGLLATASPGRTYEWKVPPELDLGDHRRGTAAQVFEN